MQENYYGQRLRQMLRWEDLNGMAHQLESRNPFADSALIAQWLNVPLKEKITTYTKEILRHAMDDYLPLEVAMRTDKKGFSVPDAKLTWKHRESWKDAFFNSDLNAFSPIKKREYVWKNVGPMDEKDLGWIFRLSALSYYLENLKS
jgi:asparagine synthetase B (glutamine-hydrolysing)